MMVYSGDVDSCVPFLGTQRRVSQLGFPPVGVYRRWFADYNQPPGTAQREAGPQIAGFVQEYQGNITFCTVRGAGHMVPTFQPEAALAFIARFFRGEAF